MITSYAGRKEVALTKIRNFQAETKRRIESLLTARAVVRKPSKKMDKKFEKRSINWKIDKNSSNYTNRDSNLFENSFLRNVKSGKNNSKSNKTEVTSASNDYRVKIMVKRSLDSFEEQIPSSRSYEEQQKNHEGVVNFESTTNKRVVDRAKKYLTNSPSGEFDDKIKKNTLNETIKDAWQSSMKRETRKNYINIQDHQKDKINNATSLDILEYDPNKIPYVEVPDYSDIREESLDEKDRQTDFIGREMSTNYEENASSKGSRERSVKENDPNLRNFDENKRGRWNNFQHTFSGRSKSDKFEDKEERLLNEARNIKDDSNNSSVDKESGEDPQESEEPRGDPEETQEDTGSESGPIIFDINEYRKPFDLDEFLKDDPIMKKLKLLEKETRTKYGQNGKRVSADFNEPESDNAFRQRASGQRNSRDIFDDPSKSGDDSTFVEGREANRKEGKALPEYFRGDATGSLEEDVDERIQEYKNLYKSPRADMEAQERRK